MAIQYFKPEVWAATLLSTLDKSHVYGGVCNRNYEGEISAHGDTVHITQVAQPTIVDYTKYTALTIEQLTDSEQLLTVDQQKAFAFEVDDIDKRQQIGNGSYMTEAARQSAYGLRDVSDRFLAAKMAGAASNALGVVDGTTAANVYDKLVVPASVALDEANVPEEMRWLVISPAAYGQLQLDARFIEADKSGNGALHNGVVGNAAGFRILKSNNAYQANRAITSTITVATTAATLTSATAGTFTQGDVGLTVAGTRITASSKILSVNADGTVATMDTAGATAGTQTDTVLSGGGQLAIAGSSIATSFAEQILKVEAFRPQTKFTDALKGLHVYGAKVVRPEALVVASVKTA